MDVAIILNMSLSMMILVITMTIPGATEFLHISSAFAYYHAVRLGINVSTTRNILLREVHQAVSLLPLVISVFKRECSSRSDHLPDYRADAVLSLSPKVQNELPRWQRGLIWMLCRENRWPLTQTLAQV